jgi:deoxyribose-phosphate aldolase
MSYSREAVAKLIDHAVLKPGLGAADVKVNAAMCRARGVGCLCVRPSDVALASRELMGSATVVASVVGFPHGASRPEVKALEAELAIADGAVELDMVMNVGRLISGDTDYVQRDIEAVVAVAHAHGALVKVILETCLLTEAQVVEACRVCEVAGADFVKTSTGFSGDGATPEVVGLMVATVGNRLKVKASGGIRTWEQAVAYLDQGCSRLGIGATETVLDGGVATSDY